MQEKQLINARSANLWLTAFTAFLMRLVYEGISTSYGVILPLVSEEFSTDVSTATLPGTINFGIGAILALFYVWLAQQLGKRLSIILGVLLSTVGLIASSFVSDVGLLILAYGIIAGVGFSLAIISADLAFARQASSQTISVQYGFVISGGALGQIIFPILDNVIRSNISWRWLFRIYGFISFATVIAALWIKPNHDNNTSKKDNEQQIRNRNICFTFLRKYIRNVALFLGPVIKNRVAFLIGISTFFLGLGATMPAYFSTDDAETIGFSDIQASLLVTFIGIGNLVGRISSGVLLSKMQRFNGILYLISISTIAGILQALLGWYNNSYAGYVIHSLINGYLIGSNQTIKLVLAYRLLPKIYEASFGYFKVFIGLATVIAGIIGGEIESTTGSYNMTYLFGGLNLLMSAAFLIPLYYISTSHSKAVSKYPSVICM